MTILLNSFHPICSTGAGRGVVKTHGLPPYVDGSIRSEPSFESKYPGISSLCRKGKLVNRLDVGDIVVYITIKDNYDQHIKHWKLVGILKVNTVLKNHQSAAQWYLSRGLAVPPNCVVPGNEPLPWERTAMTEQKARIAAAEYASRARSITRYVVCNTQYINLYNPKSIYEKDFKSIFGKVPGTQNPRSITSEELNALQKIGC